MSGAYRGRRRDRRLAPSAPKRPPEEGRGPPPEQPSDQERSRRRLTARAALALVCLHLPPPHRLGDARLFTTGRFHLWPGYQQLHERDRARICRFRILCAQGMEHDAVFARECLRPVEIDPHGAPAAGLLVERDGFEVTSRGRGLPTVAELDSWERGQGDLDLLGEIYLAPCRPTALSDELGRWMEQLEGHRAGRVLMVEANRGASRIVHTWNASYVLPPGLFSHPAPPWPTLALTPPRPLVLTRGRLLHLAARLDAAYGATRPGDGTAPPAPYREHTLREALFGGMKAEGGRRPVEEEEPLTPGELLLMISPTGTGKSVLTTVLALEMARQGTPIAVVVPRVADAWKGCLRLERDVALLQQHCPELLPRPVKITALSSTSRRFEQLAQHLAHPPDWDSTGMKVLERFGYSCALRPYMEQREGEPPLPRGEEPCHQLSYSRGPRATSRACPLLMGCDLHRPERESLDADVIFINHHALLLGVHRLPLVGAPADGDARRRPLIESILARCGLILLDEVDQLQKVMVDQDAGDLPLASRRQVSPIHRLFRDLEEHAARSPRPLTPHQDRTRRDLATIQIAAQELTHLLEPDGEVDWQPPPQIRFSGSDEGWLREVVFQDPDTPLLRRELTEADLQGLGELAPVGRALLTLANVRVDDGLTPAQRVKALDDALKPALARRRAGPPVALSVARSALVLRVLLGRLEEALRRLGFVLPELLSLNLPAAEPIQEALGASRSSSISPMGPLGRPVFGFSWRGTTQLVSPLMSLALRGDPHGDLPRLGGDLARGLVGHPRVVLGLSATAWLPGSSLCHVRGALHFYRPDREQRVEVFTGVATTRVSGVSGEEERRRACEELVEEVWPHLMKERELLLASPRFKGQDKVILVTGSYREANVVAQRLVRLMARHGMGRPWGVQPQRAGHHLYHAITHRDIEGFGGAESWVLVAPLSVISRGHNILQRVEGNETASRRSAVGSIYVLVRPVPPLADASRLLAHVTNLPIKVDEAGSGHDWIEGERREANRRFQQFMTRAGALSALPVELRRAVVCDVLAELSQLVGRARRGDTHVRLHLADGAFGGAGGEWASYLREVVQGWRNHPDGEVTLREIHATFLTAMLAAFGIDTEEVSE